MSMSFDMWRRRARHTRTSVGRMRTQLERDARVPRQQQNMSTDVAEEASNAALPGSIRVVDGCAVAEAAAIVRDSEVPVLFRGTYLQKFHTLTREDDFDLVCDLY